MIEKLKTPKSINWDDTPEGLIQRHKLITNAYKKINELCDAVNSIVSVQEKLIDSRFAVETKHEEPVENVQDDHYWFKQQERYKAALVLIRDLSGAGMSYQDMVIECREIAKLAFDPDYDAILMGRYDEYSHKLFDILRTKGGDNE